MDATGSVELEIRLMDEVQCAAHGVPVTSFESATTRALLCRLAVDPGRHVGRDAIAELLWPGRPAARALGNLRHALTSLRHAIGDLDRDRPIIEAARHTLALTPDWAWVDRAEFRRLARDRSDPHVRVAARAHELWRGPALSGLDGTMSAEWDQWVAEVRAEIDREVAHLLDRLTAARACTEPPSDVLPLVREWIALDRWNEHAHARLVALLALDGQSVAALEHAAGFVHELSTFGIEPDPELRSTIDLVRAGRSPC